MYREQQKPWTEHPIEPLLLDFLRLTGKAAILDLGCGNGRLSILAAKEGHRVVGIDSSPSAIGEANKASQAEQRAYFLVGDALQLPFPPHRFDALIDSGLFHHIVPENRPLYFQGILRVLKPNSRVYLSVFSMKNPEGIGQRFAPGAIGRLFSRFRILKQKADPFPPAAPAHILHFVMERTGA